MDSKILMNPLLAIVVLLPTLFGCSKTISNSIPSVCLTGNRRCLQGKAIVEVTTNRGIMIFELDGDASPVTSGNFLDLVNKGAYEKTVFHRVIRKPSPFVVHGGDPMSKHPETPKINYGNGGFIDLKNAQVRYIPLEIKLKTEMNPRYNSLLTNPRDIADLQLVHKKGSLAMARAQTPGSGSAQFYIALKSLPELDGRYSVFGQVVSGIDVLDEIREGDVILKINILQNK